MLIGRQRCNEAINKNHGGKVSEILYNKPIEGFTNIYTVIRITRAFRLINKKE